MSGLAELVDIYERNMSSKEDWKLSDFRKRYKDLSEHIRDAVWGFLPTRKRDSHETQIDKEVLDEVVKNLLEENVLNQMSKCKSFDEILVIVYCCKVRGFGSLSVYDTALRLGAYYNLFPDVIYLHRGAEEGAKKLLGSSYNKHVKYFSDDINYPYISKEYFPADLQKLAPYHIENFLCIFKEKL